MNGQNKVCTYLGFAKKAGKLATGMGTCTLPQIRRKLKLILVANDTAAGSIDKIERFAKSENIPCFVHGQSEEMSKATGQSGRFIFGIMDASLAGAIIKEIDHEKEVLR